MAVVLTHDLYRVILKGLDDVDFAALALTCRLAYAQAMVLLDETPGPRAPKRGFARMSHYRSAIQNMHRGGAPIQSTAPIRPRCTHVTRGAVFDDKTKFHLKGLDDRMFETFRYGARRRIFVSALTTRSDSSVADRRQHLGRLVKTLRNVAGPVTATILDGLWAESRRLEDRDAVSRAMSKRHRDERTEEYNENLAALKLVRRRVVTHASSSSLVQLCDFARQFVRPHVKATVMREPAALCKYEPSAYRTRVLDVEMRFVDVFRMGLRVRRAARPCCL